MTTTNEQQTQLRHPASPKKATQGKGATQGETATERERQHSPAPWTYEDTGDGIGIFEGKATAHPDEPEGIHLQIATCHYWSEGYTIREDTQATEHPAEENARMMAAAPELLAALKEVTHFLELFYALALLTKDDPRLQLERRAIQRACAAMNRATGGDAVFE